MQILNPNNECPNVLHFHGLNRTQLAGTLDTILTKHKVNGNFDHDKLKIVSTWTDPQACILLQQMDKHGIPLTNCVPDDYDSTKKWYMPNKIKFFIETLENTKQEIVMFLDGYDVLITHLNDVIDRFTSQPYRILFGPSCNNYPNVNIDIIHGRQNLGMYCYFNAGCCIGYREDLLKFYKEVQELVEIDNPVESEQYIMRFAFARYSKDKAQHFIGIDHKCKIFQSMGMLISDFNSRSIMLRTNIGSFRVRFKPLLISSSISPADLIRLQSISDDRRFDINTYDFNELNDDICFKRMEKTPTSSVIIKLDESSKKELIGNYRALLGKLIKYIVLEDMKTVIVDPDKGAGIPELHTLDMLGLVTYVDSLDKINIRQILDLPF